MRDKIVNFGLYSYKMPASGEYNANYDIININNIKSGGENMSYVTREEFNAKMEVVDVRFEKLENKIDSTAELILSETKSIMLENEKEQRKWFIGAIAIPIILFILSRFN